jgi:putative ABC transport system substrate-binding protein
MNRRAFITLFGSVVAAWPLAARAQQPAMPVIGVLSPRSADDSTQMVAAFRRGLAEQGYVEGRNVAFEFRWTNGQYERLPAMAAELVRKSVTLILTTGGEPSAVAAKAATSTIPIVFSMGSDPVKAGVVASFNRPGGNATGVNILTDTIEAKRLGLLRDLVPGGAIGILVNLGFVSAEAQLRDIREAARSLAAQTVVLPAGTDSEIDTAFETAARQRIAALFVVASPFFDTRRLTIIALAARHAVPTMYYFREFAVAGGLMSYGVDVLETTRQIGIYAGRILNGEKPADLPVLRPTKFELVVNMKTAKALGLTVPPGVLAIADEVIE